jgi:hypothetical protein
MASQRRHRVGIYWFFELNLDLAKAMRSRQACLGRQHDFRYDDAPLVLDYLLCLEHGVS